MLISKIKNILALLVMMMFTQVGYSASIYNCSKVTTKCVAKVQDGSVGDFIKVLDNKARVIAEGVILKKKGSFVTINITTKDQKIKKGYPVLVKINKKDTNSQTAALFSD